MANFRNQPRPGVGRRSPYPSRKGKKAQGLRLGRKLAKLAALSVLAALGWAAWERLPPRPPGPLFPIAYVRVEGGIENLDAAKLQEALRPAVGGGYFSADMGEAERVVRTFPWVDGVRLARVWVIGA